MSGDDTNGARPSPAASPPLLRQQHPSRPRSAEDAAAPPAPDGRAAGDGRAPKGWHTRGYLPHLDSDGLTQFVTYRLADSLPAEVVERLRQETGTTAEHEVDTDGTRRRAFRHGIEKYLDAGHGECWLRRPEVAQVVVDSWHHFDGVRYGLRAWVVMPNHVHVVVRPSPGFRLPELVSGWKSFTAREINRVLGRSGHVWMPDYWDTYIRDRDHYDAAVRYIHRNPVKAGLCATPEEWPWSSAGARVDGARPSPAALPADAEGHGSSERSARGAEAAEDGRAP